MKSTINTFAIVHVHSESKYAIKNKYTGEVGVKRFATPKAAFDALSAHFAAAPKVEAAPVKYPKFKVIESGGVKVSTAAKPKVAYTLAPRPKHNELSKDDLEVLAFLVTDAISEVQAQGQAGADMDGDEVEAFKHLKAIAKKLPSIEEPVAEAVVELEIVSQDPVPVLSEEQALAMGF